MKILTINDKKISEIFKGASKTVTLTNLNIEKHTGDFVVDNKSFSFTFEAGESDKKINLLSKIKINLKTGVVNGTTAKNTTPATRPLTPLRPFI